MKKRTSDIHIEPQKDEIRVRYRIDGELVTAATIDKEKQTQIIGRLKAISNIKSSFKLSSLSALVNLICKLSIIYQNCTSIPELEEAN